MTFRIKIISPGLQSSIQDLGRVGFLEFGVPRSGTVVPHWMVLGNSIVGNPDMTAGIEFRLIGPTIQAIDSPVKLVVCGNVVSSIRQQNASNEEVQKIPGWRSFTLDPGAEVTVGTLKDSAAGFIAIAGGMKLKPVLGSCSTYARSKIGGDVLRMNDQIELNPESEKLALMQDRTLPKPPVQNVKDPLRVVPGPQDNYFTEIELEKFFVDEFVVSTISDRMGARLDGTLINHKPDMPAEIASDGIVPGAIQVPGNGQPIVLLNDGQTVGGYPKIATVISCDLHRVANALPGSKLRFEKITANKACMIARYEHDKLQQSKDSITPFISEGYLDLQELHRGNLISGVVDSTNPDNFPGHLEDERDNNT